MSTDDQTQRQNSPARVLLVDDHPVVRQGLRAMLNVPDIEVVGEATCAGEALALVATLKPDVVLMDVHMPDMDGIAATSALKSEAPTAAVIIITGVESKEQLRRAIEAGATGYLVKGMSRDVLIEAVRVIKEGGSLIDARALSEIFLENGTNGAFGAGTHNVGALSPRELQVLRLLSAGLTNKEIAREMNYSVGTVKNAVQRIIEKFGVADRTQAAVLAVRAGLDMGDSPRA